MFLLFSAPCLAAGEPAQGLRLHWLSHLIACFDLQSSSAFLSLNSNIFGDGRVTMGTRFAAYHSSRSLLCLSIYSYVI